MYAYWYTYASRMMAAVPCLENITYWSDKFSVDSLFLNDKSGLGNHAELTNSNALSLNGTNTIDCGNVYQTQDPYVKFIGRFTTLSTYNYVIARTTTLIEYLLYQTANKFRFLIADASDSHTVYLVDSSITINNTDYFEIEGFYDRLNSQITIRCRNLTTGGAWVEDSTACGNTISFAGSTNAVIAYDDVLNSRHFIGQMCLLEIKDYLTDTLIDNISFSSATNHIFGTKTNNSYPISGSKNLIISVRQDKYHEKILNGFSNYLLFGKTGYTDIKHQHSDKIVFDAYINVKNENSAMLFISGFTAANKGIYMRNVAGLKLEWGYTNGTAVESWQNAGTPVILEGQNRITMTYENGEFEVQCNNTIETSTVTIAAFTGDSTLNIELNTQTTTSVFQPDLKINNVPVSVSGIPASEDKIYTVDGLRLGYPQYNVTGKSLLNILRIGQSNMAGAGNINEIDTDDYRYLYEKCLYWSDNGYRPAGTVTVAGYGAASTMFGSDMELMRLLTQYVDEVRVVKESYGGSNAEAWDNEIPGNWLDSSIQKTIDAGMVPDCIHLMQGESNTNPDLVASWIDVWGRNVAYLKGLFPSVKIIVARLNPDMSYDAAGIAAINAQIDAWVLDGTIEASINTDGLPLIPDLHHYTYAGNNTIGGLFFDEMESLYSLTPLTLGSIKNQFLNCETKLTLPAYGALSFDEIRNNTDVGSKIFYRIIYSGVQIVGIQNLLTYSVAPTGVCANKTNLYVNAPFVTHNGERVTYNGELVTSFKTE